MKKIILTTIFAISVVFLFAQDNIETTDNRPLHNLNLNFGGEGSLVAVNFERLFFINPQFFITGQLGIGYNEEFLLFGGQPEKYTSIPHHITANIGKRKNFFEFGLSGAIISGNTDNHYLLGPILGYRLQPLKSNKVNFRVYSSIPVIVGLNTETLSYAGFSFGICF